MHLPQLTSDLHVMDMDIKSLFARKRLIAVSTTYGYFSNKFLYEKPNATFWYHSPLELSACSFAAEAEIGMLIPVVNSGTLLPSKHLVANFAFPASKMHVHDTDWTSHDRGEAICTTASWIGNCDRSGRRILSRDGDRDPVVNEHGLVDG